MAEHVEHTVDVDGMLDRMTPEEFAGWEAKDLVEPIGYQSRMLGFIAYAIASFFSGEDTEINPQDFMPWEQPAKQKVNNAAARKLVQAVLGQPTKE